jgi:2-iminobutanoate/2-iminopropanoate deaminase
MADRQEYRVPEIAEPISHYTDAVRLGDLLFISGCVATDAAGNLVGGDDVTAQARQALKNIGHILAAAGATPADVARVTVYLTDIEDRPKVNIARREFFGETRPASTLIEISRLPVPGAKVEIEAIARITLG